MASFKESLILFFAETRKPPMRSRNLRMLRVFALSLMLCAHLAMFAIPLEDDTTHMSGVLNEVVVEKNIRGNYLNSQAVDKREMISVTGLRKMACCTLAESFENSASVSVDYSDAVSGTRQIKMLGLAGVYTQFLDESRPFMRGLSSPYALNYTPGDWLKSIQVSKGVSSVTTGHEAITGQINLEYRKPTDDERLHLNFYLDDMLRPELNLTTAIPLKKDKSLTTIIMAHGAIDTDWREMKAMDRNHDTFRDQPNTRQIDVANRWFWLLPSGVQLRWGGKFTAERRLGGQLHFDGDRSDYEAAKESYYNHRNTPSEWDMIFCPSLYGSKVINHDASTYFKMGVPLRRIVTDKQGNELQDNVALITDFTHFDTKSYFGYNEYDAHENTVSLNLRFDHHFSGTNSIATGLQGRMNFARGHLYKYGYSFYNNGNGLMGYECEVDEHIDEREVGAYAEWTATPHERFTMIAGLRADYNDFAQEWMITPRAHIKWDITPHTTLRASGGLGYRTPRALIENLGMLATGYPIRAGDAVLPMSVNLSNDNELKEKARSDYDYRHMEKALTVGGSMTQTFTLGRDNNASLSADFFHTRFMRSLIATQEPMPQYMLLYSSTGLNYTSTWQMDFNWSPIERLDVLATMRYTHSRVEIPVANKTNSGYYLSDQTQTVERALMSRFKGLINVSYATRFRVWVFDFTTQINGPMRVPGGQFNTEGSYHSPTYAQLFAQVTHKIGRGEMYVGCENITDYRQKDAIIAANVPFSREFNSMNVWGPLMGRKFYVGMRWNFY